MALALGTLEKNIVNVLGKSERPLVFVYGIGLNHSASFRMPEKNRPPWGRQDLFIGLKRLEKNITNVLGKSQRSLVFVNGNCPKHAASVRMPEKNRPPLERQHLLVGLKRLEENIANVLGKSERPLVFVYGIGPKHAASVPECPTILLDANTSSSGLKRHAKKNSA